VLLSEVLDCLAKQDSNISGCINVFFDYRSRITTASMRPDIATQWRLLGVIFVVMVLLKSLKFVAGFYQRPVIYAQAYSGTINHCNIVVLQLPPYPATPAGSLLENDQLEHVKASCAEQKLHDEYSPWDVLP
jgi:hypothetical protein